MRAALPVMALLATAGCMHTTSFRTTRDVAASRYVAENGTHVELSAAAGASGTLVVTATESTMCRDFESGRREPVERRTTEKSGCFAHPVRCVFAPVVVVGVVAASILLGPNMGKILDGYFSCNQSHVEYEDLPVGEPGAEYSEWRGVRGACPGATPRPAGGVAFRATAAVEGRCVAWTARTGDAGKAIIRLDPSVGAEVACGAPPPEPGTVRLEVEGLPAGDPEAFAPIRTARGVSVAM